jgi:hypothetical protein
MVRLADVSRTLEHHMFEQMSETRTLRVFILAPDVIPHIDRDHI